MHIFNRRALLTTSLIAAITATTPLGLAIAHADSDYLVLSQYSGAPGSTIQVQGYGFSPNQSISITSNGSDTTNITSDGSGDFSSAYTTPSNSGNVTIDASDSSVSSDASYYVQGYYPTAQPSNYYILPGQMLSFSGSGFWPGEPVNLVLNGSTISSTTANGGTVNFANSYTVGFGSANMTLNFQLAGQWSQSSVPVNISVGTYYPQISPSSYYLAAWSGLSVDGSGFAPNEPVTVVGGGINATVTADGSGNFTWSGTAPSAGSVTITASGQWSNTSSSRTITTY